MKKKKRVQTNIRLSEALKNAVREEADRLEISFNDYVTIAVLEYIRDQK